MGVVELTKEAYSQILGRLFFTDIRQTRDEALQLTDELPIDDSLKERHKKGIKSTYRKRAITRGVGNTSIAVGFGHAYNGSGYLSLYFIAAGALLHSCDYLAN